MTEVMPETPMKIQEEEIKVQDVFEHLIKILDISEQNVNNMKEWMTFQGLEDILQILGALYRDPDGRMDKYEQYTNTEGNQTFLPRHVASNLSLLSPKRIFKSEESVLGQRIHQESPNANTNGCMGQSDQGRISAVEDQSRSGSNYHGLQHT